MKTNRPAELTDDDLVPLLQATASRALDTCLMGARGLAMLGDPRALGLLLQLSREEDAAARVEVCRALAALDDPRSIRRLRSLLYDPQAEVRDAAFSALAHIHESEPLRAAESGLSAAFEDVRRRGLELLVREIKKKPPTKADQPAWQLLVRALNDSFEGVRGEAFKAALNLQIAAGGIHTLRFVLQSVHADVRREVLTEAMAQIAEPWAWNLLLEFFNDHDARLRDEAFQFAIKKNKDLPPLEAGLLSQHADVRLLAVDGLIKKHSRAAQALLVRAVADAEKNVRLKALEALVAADAQQELTQALVSPHDDVRVRAAKALARHGAQAALAPLLALAAAPEPEQRERQGDWATLVQQALEGLAELGDPAALGHVAPLLASRHPAIRRAAAQALVWIALPNHHEALRQALQHSDDQVKYRAALGLAYAGDPLAAPLVFSDQAAPVLSVPERLVAALTLGPAGEDQLVVFLDDADESIRNQALLLLLLLELKAHTGSPARLLACLSSRMPRVRLTAARALECFADPTAFLDFVVQLFNDRGEAQAWKIPAKSVETFADLVAFGPPQVRARTAHLLRHLSEEKQSAWDQAWLIHQTRFAAEITAARQVAQDHPPPAPSPLPLAPASGARGRGEGAQLRQLAFGGYVGLVREQGGTHGRQRETSTAPQIVRVRQTALGRILALAKVDEALARAAGPVFIQAMGDPNQALRFQAFEQQQALDMDRTALGAEALETGHTDLGVKGLELLSGGAADKRGQKVLEEVLLTRNDGLSVEAAKLLIAQRGPVAVAGQALAAAHEELRKQAVLWLAAEYDKDDKAKKLLREALDSRYRKVRNRAALELANKKDAAAFDSLVQLLHELHEPAKQKRVIQALVTLGDPRAPDAFLDRIENDPSGTAQAGELFQAAGNFRQPENADRLLALFERRDEWRNPAFEALRAISGHDQDIEDPEDERPDRTWEQKQHPRHDGILARLMERSFALGKPRLVEQLVPAARWARGREVDAALALLVAHPDEDLRNAAVEALGWRLRKRQGPAEPLLRALQHKDAQTQFLAAEALAKAGRAEGLSVLLSSVELLTDLDLRQRAVTALGELGDRRALDLLLKLANEPDHVLQAQAVEALGHLGKSEKAEEIAQLLERLGKGNDDLAQHALQGLRWLNTRAGWQLIRKRATDEGCWFREVAVELLGHNDDPATRDLLLKVLATSEEWEPALASARRLWGKDALDPDYALLQNHAAGDSWLPDEVQDALKRVCERGDARRIIEIVPNAPEQVRAALEASLFTRPELPVDEARTSVAGADAVAVRLAAQILGRGGARAAGAKSAVQTALEKWRGEWEERRQKMLRGLDVGDLEPITACLQSLLWAAGRLGVAPDALLAAATARPDDPAYRPVRTGAVVALTSGKLTPAVLAALEAAAVGNDPEVRATAAEAIARHDPARAAALAERLLSDRVSFDRVASVDGKKLEKTLRTAAGQVHYQGVAVPHLIAHGDVDALAAVAADRKLPEAARLGAIEGLGRLARPDAEAKLAAVGSNKQEEEEVRKAAWRALRRSKRARQLVKPSTGRTVQ